MRRDDVFLLFENLGLPVSRYYDLQVESGLRARVQAAKARRAAAARRERPAGQKSAVVAVIACGEVESTAVVAALAGSVARRLGGKKSVHRVGLGGGDQGAAVVGVRQLSIEAPASRSGGRDWLRRRIEADPVGGLYFVDVPERVAELRGAAVEAADLLLVLLPANAGAVRDFDEFEQLLGEAGDVLPEMRYVLVEDPEGGDLSPQLRQELMALQGLFAPVCLVGGAALDVMGNRGLADIGNYIVGRFSE